MADRKLLLVSDTHGFRQRLEAICMAENDADEVFFMGDGCSDIDWLRIRHPELKVTAVKGNNDYAAMYPYETVAAEGQYRILIAHGHRFSLRASIESVISGASLYECTAVFYGHTHRQLYKIVDGITAVNPGSVKSYGDTSCYAVVTVPDRGDMKVELKTMTFTDGER